MSTYPHDEDEGPAGEEDEVADEEAGDPDDGEAHVDELEALRRPRQEVPALQFLGDEPLRDLILDDGGDARLDVVEDVLQLELGVNSIDILNFGHKTGSSFWTISTRALQV